MKYRTENEFAHFEFEEAHVRDLELGGDYMRFWLDNVKILPENSQNRDIRLMRANNLLVTIHDMKINSFVREGVKIYDANGSPKGSRPDEEIAESAYMDILPLFLGGAVVEFVKETGTETNTYVIAVDANDECTYAIQFAGRDDTEEWEKFLNLDSM